MSTNEAAPSSFVSIPDNPRRVKKRLIVCCDGTWEDGILMKDRWMYTNIIRLARAVNHEDARLDPPIHQIVYYQAGIGSEHNLYAEYVQGATGASLGEKVQEAYAFIAHNYQPGDEIFLFGFSRGAYTARMTAMCIGEIGVLDRTEMDHFADIFISLQKRGKSKDSEEIKNLDEHLNRWTSPDAFGKKRAASGADGFSVKCVGVFDTVGSLGLPDELRLRAPKAATIFGFPNDLLGEHIQYAFQALALNETRKDFNCTKFVQTEAGKLKNQVLKQCWFVGEHSDIGGGWHDHDLSDVTLTWMIANTVDFLSIDEKYMHCLPQPSFPWGEQPPHNALTGMYKFAETIRRKFPTALNPITNEHIHASVLQQANLNSELKDAIQAHPELVQPLMPLEQNLKDNWPYVPGKYPPKDKDYYQTVQQEMGIPTPRRTSNISSSSFVDTAVTVGSAFGMKFLRKIMDTETRKTDAKSGPPTDMPTGLARLAIESPIGPFLKELAPDSSPKSPKSTKL